MILKIKFVLTFGLFAMMANAFAQPILTLNEAIKIGLENNYSLKISKNDLSIADNNVSLANAGILPRVDFNVTDNNSITNTEQELSNGITQKSANANNTNLAYGPVLSWRIFDGFGMFARYDQLEELKKIGEQNLNLTIQNTIAQISTVYFDLVQQKKQMEALKSAIEISTIRLRNSQSRFEIGKAAKLEVLAAKVDLNTDTTNLLRQQNLFANTKIQLNELIARESIIDFEVLDTIINNKIFEYADLETKISNQNPEIQSAIYAEMVANFNRKQVRALRYPQVSVSTGYNFSRSTSDLGFARSSQNRGLNYGFTASIPLFNGLLQKRNEKNATISIESARFQKEEITLNITSRLRSEYQTYLTNERLTTLEKRNVEIAKQNLQVSFDKFSLGSVAPLELREAQRNFIDANTRFSLAQFDLKISEINLLQLSGQLLTETSELKQ